MRYHCALWVWPVYGGLGWLCLRSAWDCAVSLWGPASLQACCEHPRLSLAGYAFFGIASVLSLAVRAAQCLRGRVTVGPGGIEADTRFWPREHVAWDDLAHILVPSTGRLRGELRTRSGRTIELWYGIRGPELVAAIGQWVELGPPIPSQLFPTFIPRREYAVLGLRAGESTPPS